MRRHFESFEEFVSAAHTEPKSDIGREVAACWAKSDKYEIVRFCGGATWAECVRFAREGWPEGRELAEKFRASFDSLLGSKTRRAVTSHCVMGFAADVGAFCAGDPENMFSREYVDADAIGKTLKIVFNGSCSAGVEVEELAIKGAISVALIDAIEAAGIRCEIEICYRCDSGGVASENTVCIKRLSEPVEIDRLAFALIHPSSFRRLGFAIMEQDTAFIANATFSHGRPTDATDRGDVYIGASSLYEMTSDPVTWAKSQLAALGITFED